MWVHNIELLLQGMERVAADGAQIPQLQHAPQKDRPTSIATSLNNMLRLLRLTHSWPGSGRRPFHNVKRLIFLRCRARG
jgi:hypothetical protein